MDNYSKVLTFFMENGILLTSEQLEALKEGLFFKNKKDKNINNTDAIMKYSAVKVSGSKFDYLYDTEAMCGVGVANADSDKVHKEFAEYISKNWTDVDHNKEIKFYYCKGKDLNNYYHLTDKNKFDNNISILFVDCKALGDGGYKHKGNFRWFSDVIDNRARPEIVIYHNPYYKNYHSLYGDKWFYGESMEKCFPKEHYPALYKDDKINYTFDN